jgi:hypothetical protein
MSKLRAAALALLLVVVAGLAVPLSAKDDKDCEYYPLAVGTTWTFDVSGTRLSITVAEHEKLRGVLCARLESYSEGGTPQSEHLAVHEDGVYRHASNGIPIVPPLCVLKLPYKKGSDWTVKSKQGRIALGGKLALSENDDLDVPAGTFKTIVANGEFEAKDSSFTSTIYYAKGKGPVKQEFQTGGQSYRFELRRFRAGTGKPWSEDEEEDEEKKKPEGKKSR